MALLGKWNPNLFPEKQGELQEYCAYPEGGAGADERRLVIEMKGCDFMHYVISDIHGCYREYIALLKKINFSSRDYLYVLGDAVDRGPNPMDVLKDIMRRNNVTFIIGNHDFLLFHFMKKSGFTLCDFTDKADLQDFAMYLQDGGISTVETLLTISDDEKGAVYDFLRNASVYETIEHNGNRYILVHAGITGFDEQIPLEYYEHTAFIFERMDYSKRYYQNKNTYIISGHTPTFYIEKDFFTKKNKRPEIYTANGHIAIDCGCVYGGRLAAYCIETGLSEYVDYISGTIEEGEIK